MYDVCEYGGVNYWSEFDMTLPVAYRRYLAPTNIQLLPQEIEDETEDGYALSRTPKSKHNEESSSDTSHDEVMVAVPRREKNFMPASMTFTDFGTNVHELLLFYVS
ncbi:hypothetical protein PHYSODRAFT_251682 [Phytophthora sojae]|uniref:Uncharacterized protein n=1 Tax=Phytophthora sojae (strain P6497) TaxID=1094619 RepID=G5AID0_PHYSP|nr:hypothetical protein PHYSODRAFT_251682 [Phytophthora sojae]EGZ04732.1 hypothetical protein PHYSODRAFT_251682 [Phytophthora sojae]|eukprot:XP_009539831.1 hypothetical protein PHYSODRAFT_251682 [Phytophthora sojae]